MEASVSVAIATYRGVEFIEQQLRSICEQTHQPREIVIVDDASPDTTVAELERFKTLSPVPIKILACKQNQGSTASFAEAIAHCEGDWIACADQDDVWRRHKLEVLLHAAYEQRADAVFSDAELVDAQLRPIGKRLWDDSRFTPAMRRLWQGGEAFAMLLRYNVVTGTTLMFRRDWRDNLLPIPQPWVHDYWIALFIAAHARVAWVDQPLVLYRQHGNNQIGQKLGLSGQYAAARQKDSAEYLREAEQFELFQTAIRRCQRSSLPAVTSLLQAKQEFLQSRYRLRSGLRPRILQVSKNIWHGSYFRFGQGWRPLLKDLMGF